MELKGENSSGIEIVLLCYVDRKPRDYNQTFICPFCRSTYEKVSNFTYANLQYDDYVKEPMLWCESCGARSFLDIDLDVFTDLVENSDSKNINNKYYVPLTSDIHMYKFHLKKVKCVRPNNFDYTSNIKLSDQQVRELCELNCYKYKQLSEEIIKKYNLCQIEGDNDDEYDEKLMNIALLCDSYNVMKPVVPYPKSANFSHDGVYLRCQVEDEEGNIKNTCFWGD